jgi:hypothetical protein
VGAVGDVGRLERGSHVRLGVDAGHVLLRVLVLEASHLGLDVGIFLRVVRLCITPGSRGGGLQAAQRARPS